MAAEKTTRDRRRPRSAGAQAWERRRRSKHARRRWAFVAVLAVVVAWAVLFFFPVLTVKNVDVQGAKNADVQQVSEASGVGERSNMLRLDTEQVARNVAPTPWVKKVTVSRSWPSTVTIQITEHEAVGVLDEGGETSLIDRDGKVFLKGPAPEGAVPFTKVKDGDTRALAAGAAAVNALQPENRKQLVEVAVPNAEAVEMTFELPAPEGEAKPRKVVYFGAAEQLTEKAEAVRVVLQREQPTWNVSNPAMPTARD